jgi:hypothetical protein
MGFLPNMNLQKAPGALKSSINEIDKIFPKRPDIIVNSFAGGRDDFFNCAAHIRYVPCNIDKPAM